MWRVGRTHFRVWSSVLLLLLTVTGVLVIAAAHTKLAGEEVTPSGLRRDRSLYLTMKDGTPLAVDVWLPADYRTGERLPVLMRSTPYWRAIQPHLGLRLLVLLHLISGDTLVQPEDEYLSRQNFVLVLVDLRGSGASGGERPFEFSPQGVGDLGAVAQWAASQSWSNGRVGAYGTSYESNLAELLAGTGAVRAVAPSFGDFDIMLGYADPGGIFDRATVVPWSAYLFDRDHDNACAGVGALHCLYREIRTGGVKHVDADDTGAELKSIVEHRHNPPVTNSVGRDAFRDEVLHTDAGVFTWADMTPWGHHRAIESSNVPMMVWCGWMDAGTADGALSRYLTFSNPQILYIGAYTHGGAHGTDPFLRQFDTPDPPQQERWRAEANFFNDQLRRSPAGPVESQIHYYTMGKGKWQVSRVWPPVGFQVVRYFFGAARRLTLEAPVDLTGGDQYEVEQNATTGYENRWLTQLGAYVDYGDRHAADSRLLTYTSEALNADTEVTGSPVLNLEMSSTSKDGAVFGYLEDVTPDGQTTYLTEGELRLIDRKLAPRPLPYAALGPAHSFLRADVEAMPPGKVQRVQFSMLATSLLLRRGHRIRIALAGADSGTFAPVPESGAAAHWIVFRDRVNASWIDVPMRAH